MSKDFRIGDILRVYNPNFDIEIEVVGTHETSRYIAKYNDTIEGKVINITRINRERHTFTVDHRCLFGQHYGDVLEFKSAINNTTSLSKLINKIYEEEKEKYEIQKG